MARLADNEYFTIVARLSMLITPILFAGWVYLFPQWMSGQFASQDAFSSLSLRVSLAEQRLSGTERNLERLEEIRQELAILSSRISVLTAQLNGFSASAEQNR